MKRKIIRQGHNTMTLTLPSDWIKRFNLEAGSEVDLIERDNGLFISSEKKNEHRAIEFDIDSFDIPTIWKYFMGIYREGYDEVKVKFNPSMKVGSPYKFFSQHKLDIKYKKETETKPIVEFLTELITRFIGWEIIDYGADYVLIKEMTEPTSKEFDNSLRRVFLLIEQMADEVTAALKSGNRKSLTHIHNVDINVDKFHDYCIRILNKVGNKEARKTSLLFSTLYLLEMLGDEYKTISHHLVQDYSDADFKSIIDVADSIKEEIYLFYDLFYKFDKEKVIHMSELDKGRYFNVSKKKVNEKEAIEIFHHLRTIARYINALLELRIEMQY